jgi:hypothetical protein
LAVEGFDNSRTANYQETYAHYTTCILPPRCQCVSPIPFFGDQLFWGQCVAELGVGPIPIPRKQLNSERLAEAIHRVMTDQSMRQRAAELGAKIQAEDGVANAVAIVQDLEKRGAFRKPL